MQRSRSNETFLELDFEIILERKKALACSQYFDLSRIGFVASHELLEISKIAVGISKPFETSHSF